MKNITDIINNEYKDLGADFQDLIELPEVLFYTPGGNYTYLIGEFKGLGIYAAVKILIDEATGEPVNVLCPKTVSTLTLETINLSIRQGVLTKTTIEIDDDRLVIE